VAQLVERDVRDVEAAGSSPVTPTKEGVCLKTPSFSILFDGPICSISFSGSTQHYFIRVLYIQYKCFAPTFSEMYLTKDIQ
jgi:hypothetical protein